MGGDKIKKKYRFKKNGNTNRNHFQKAKLIDVLEAIKQSDQKHASMMKKLAGCAESTRGCTP